MLTTQDARLEIRLLGPFRILLDGVEVDAERWKRRRPVALVKLLALQPAHRLHREMVIEALWPDLDPEAAANQFYKALHLARRALEPDRAARTESSFIVTKDHSISLVDAIVDADVFEERAKNALRDTDLERCVSALSVYVDDLAPEDPYEDWAGARRDALRLLRIRLLHHAASLAIREDSFARGEELLTKLLSIDASDEGAHRALMTVYARTSRRHLARRQYHECIAAVRRDLDAEPTPETVALFEAIERETVTAPTTYPRTIGPVTGPAMPERAPVPVLPHRRPARWLARRLTAALCTVVAASILGLPVVAPIGLLGHKLDLFFEKTAAAFDGESLDRPRLVTLSGRVDTPGARLEALDSISGWATIANATGEFTLLDVRWRAGESIHIVCSEPTGAPRMLIVTAPSTYPADGQLELGEVSVDSGQVVDTSELYGFNSVSLVDYDAANASYFRGVYDALAGAGASDDERVTALNAFVARRYTFEQSPVTDPGPRRVIESGTSNSGALTITMATLCRAGGYPVRMIDMTDLRGNRRSHMVVEIYFGQAWHVFDPAYGIVIRAADGHIPSYADVRRDPTLIAAGEFAAVSRPGWATPSIPSLYVSGIHHYYMFRNGVGEREAPTHRARGTAGAL